MVISSDSTFTRSPRSLTASLLTLGNNTGYIPTDLNINRSGNTRGIFDLIFKVQ